MREKELISIAKRALAEDIGSGDVTTDSIVPPHLIAQGEFVVKETGVIAGLSFVQWIFRLADESVVYSPLIPEGSPVTTGDVVATVRGPARSILTVERTALNFLQRMSGIATLTRRYVDAVAGTRVVILDTRKTAPGLRALDKWAVRLGGGSNHRMGLYDMVLIKDNHIEVAGGITEAVRRVRSHDPGLPIEVEVKNLAEFDEALTLDVDRIMLDNMSLEEMREAVRRANGRVKIEASGGVTLERVKAIAATGVDYISVGALTHSVKALDISLEITGDVSE